MPRPFPLSPSHRPVSILTTRDLPSVFLAQEPVRSTDPLVIDERALWL